MAQRHLRLTQRIASATVGVLIVATGLAAGQSASSSATRSPPLLREPASTTTTATPVNPAASVLVAPPTTKLAPSTTRPRSKRPTPMNTVPAKLAPVDSARTLAPNELPDGWFARTITPAEAPFDCRHVQPGLASAKRTERVGYVGPAGQAITERLDVFSDELTALRARNRLVERLSTCTSATYMVGTERFGFTREAVSFQSEQGPTTVRAWRELTFGLSPITDTEYLYVFVTGASVVSLWTSTEGQIGDARNLIAVAAAAASAVPDCRLSWEAKGLRRCRDGRLDLYGRRIFGVSPNASPEFALFPGRFVTAAPRNVRNGTPAPNEISRSSFSFRTGLTLIVVCTGAGCRGDLSPLPPLAREGTKTDAVSKAAPTATIPSASSPSASITVPPTTSSTSTSTSTTRPTTSTSSTTTSTSSTTTSTSSTTTSTSSTTTSTSSTTSTSRPTTSTSSTTTSSSSTTSTTRPTTTTTTSTSTTSTSTSTTPAATTTTALAP